MRYITTINGQQYEIDIDKDGNVSVNGKPRHVDFLQLDATLFSVITDSRSLEAVIEETRGKQQVMIGGHLFEAQVQDERTFLMMTRRKGQLSAESGEVVAPMPGLIVGVRVSAGDNVRKGQTVVILESMKMQNELKASLDGVIDKVMVQQGQTVDKDAVLVTIKPSAPDDEA